MTLLRSPSIPASAPRRLLAATLAAAALLLLWAPATTFAREGGKQTQAGTSLKTALLSAGVLRRGAGYERVTGSVPVRRLQLRLRTLGFRPGPIDGLFGPLTQGAVERFQLARRLTVDGVVGPVTTRALVRPVGRESRPDRPAVNRSGATQRTADRPPATSPRDVAPESGRVPAAPTEPQPSDGLAPELAAGLGALAMAVLLGSAWFLGGRRRSPAVNIRLGMVCASLLAVFAMGSVAGALFATRASPDERQTEKTQGTAATSDATAAGGAQIAAERRTDRSRSSP